MWGRGKFFTVIMIVIMAISSLSLLTIKLASAQSVQSIPVPSVPQFTLKYTDHSYDVAPTTTSTTNPYNGNTTTTTVPGYHVRNFTIEVTITNPTFHPVINGNDTGYSYNVRGKGHFQEDWTSPDQTISTALQPQSNTEYTVLSFRANGYQPGDELDFQVQAVLSYSYKVYDYSHPPQVFSGYQVVSNSSDWSNIQTITIPASSSSASPTSTLTPTPASTAAVPELSWLAVVPLLVSVLLIAVVIRHKKAKYG